MEHTHAGAGRWAEPGDDQPHLAGHARDYIALYAVEINTSGKRSYHLAAFLWSTVPGRERYAGDNPVLQLRSGAGQPVRLTPMTVATVVEQAVGRLRFQVRRFNEQANEEAGDHFTPREVIKLMVKLLFTHDDLVYKPAKVIKIYDPTCGTGGMLSESEKLIADPDSGLNPGANVQLFGQEYNPESYAICGSDLMIKGEGVENIVFGDTLGTGKAKEGFADGDGHPNERFHYMLANPPFGVEWRGTTTCLRSARFCLARPSRPSAPPPSPAPSPLLRT